MTDDNTHEIETADEAAKKIREIRSRLEDKEYMETAIQHIAAIICDELVDEFLAVRKY